MESRGSCSHVSRGDKEEVSLRCIYLIFFFIYLFRGVCECVSVFVYKPVPHQVCRSQKTSCRTQFSSSKIRVLELKLYRNQVRTSLDSASQFCLFVCSFCFAC